MRQSSSGHRPSGPSTPRVALTQRVRFLASHLREGPAPALRASRIGMVLLLSIGAALALLQPRCAYACSCVAPGSPGEELQRSDAVFLGTVVDVRPAAGPIDDPGDVTTATFAVSSVWKGDRAQTQTITTPGSSASCGVTFEQGKRYVVYAQVRDGKLTAILCSRTALAETAAEDIAALGAGQPPEANVPPAQLPATGADHPTGGLGDASPFLVLAGVTAMVVGLLLIGAARAQRAVREP